MRVSTNLLTLRLAASLKENTAGLAKVTQQISTGRRYDRFSEAPVDANVYMRTERDLEAITQYRRIAQGLNATLDTQASVMGQLGDILDNARQIAIEQSGSNASAETRAASAVTVDALLQQAINLGNTRVGNEFIFGGTLTGAPPFGPTGTYSGNNQSRQVEIGEGITIDVGVDGERLMNTNPGGPGNINLLQVLTDLRNALQANNGTAAGNITTQIEPLFTHIQSRIAEIGSRTRSLDAQIASLNELDALFEGRIRTASAANLEQTSVELAQRQTAMQSALAATSRLLNLNLISFLR